MIRASIVAVASMLLLGTSPARVADGAFYTPDGHLKYPDNYREWVFLSSGLDMSYNPKADEMGDGMFNNVFVNPESCRAYQASGHWPEGTMLVLENRGAALGSAHQPLLKSGKVQTSDLMGMEVHVLDSAHEDPNHRADGWAFYNFEGKGNGTLIPRPATCYTCHQQHAAVDTTFVQFYPTLLDAAKQHSTFSSSYRKDLNSK